MTYHQSNEGVTFIIPCLNEEFYIEKLLNTLLKTSNNNEIIILDGGSQDRTLSILNKIKKRITIHQPSLKIINNPKKTQASAINLGLKTARNKICLRIDSHSMILNDSKIYENISEIINILKNRKDICAIGFKQRFAFKNVIQASLFLLSFTPILSSTRLYRYALWKCRTYKTAWLFALNKNLAYKVKGFDERCNANEDYDFNQKIIKYENKPILIFPNLYIYYFPRASIKTLFSQYVNYGKGRVNNEFFKKEYGKGLGFIVLRILIFIFTSIFILASYVIFPFTYVALAIVILNLTIFHLLFDKGNYLRQARISNIKFLTLAIGLIISPIISTIPLFASGIGSINALKNNLFFKNK